jgi:hypothetical protein
MFERTYAASVENRPLNPEEASYPHGQNRRNRLTDAGEPASVTTRVPKAAASTEFERPMSQDVNQTKSR